MVELPTRYYVQRAQSHSKYGERGWLTLILTFDREEADAYAKGFERAQVFEDGEDISETTVTLARVVTADELRAESEEALLIAEVSTRLQFWDEMEKWASPLIAPGHE
jgi:hypothetical protein